jgi:hypothetical protein
MPGGEQRLVGDALHFAAIDEDTQRLAVIGRAEELGALQWQRPIQR